MNSITKKMNLLALISTLGSISIHTYLTLHYYDIKLGTATGEAFCNISQKINCDAVSASPFAAFLGSPMALWGILTNGVLALLLLVSFLRLSTDVERIKRYALYLGTLILTTSLVMGSISLMIVKIYCLFCIGAYALSLVTFLCLLKTQESSNKSSNKMFSSSLFFDDLKKSFTEFKWVAVMIALIPIGSLIGNSIILEEKGFGKIEEYLKDAIAEWQTNPTNMFNESGLTHGSKDAKITIVEFADFRCSHCKHAVATMRAFRESHSDVKFYFKFFPLDSKCNPSENLGAGDGASCTLAQAVFCAEKIGQKGWNLHDEIYANQEAFFDSGSVNNTLDRLIEQVGLNKEAIRSCINSEESFSAVKAMATEGVNAKVHGTPSVYVNGRYLKLGQTLPGLEKAYSLLKDKTE
jgi:protein-disulfide isomerase/uncharacterized membrane protein